MTLSATVFVLIALLGPFLIRLLWGSIVETRAPTAPAHPITSLESSTNFEEHSFLQKQWVAALETQMHFNDMIMKMRTLAFTVVSSIFGAAAIVFGQYPNRVVTDPLPWISGDVHIAALVAFAGIALLAAFYLLDYFYYFRLLIGSVQGTYQFDSKYANVVTLSGATVYGMSTQISAAIGPRDFSNVILFGFYSIIFSTGVVFVHILSG